MLSAVPGSLIICRDVLRRRLRLFPPRKRECGPLKGQIHFFSPVSTSQHFPSSPRTAFQSYHFPPISALRNCGAHKGATGTWILRWWEHPTRRRESKKLLRILLLLHCGARSVDGAANVANADHCCRFSITTRPKVVFGVSGSYIL